MPTSQDAPPVLEVEHLSDAYNGTPAVDDASFAIRRGEIFGLLGPNGAGKTTTIRCIAGLRKPRRGTLRFAGTPFTPDASREQRAWLGVVPQELALYEDLTGRENLDFFARMSGLSGGDVQPAVAQALELAGLAERADDRTRDYSGGMKRRLNLVVGGLHDPELLILDEPTVGVDPQSRNHIFDALTALRTRGRTLLYTTHYMEEAERLCDRVAIMDVGRIVAIGTAGELQQQAGVPGENLEAVFLKLTGKRLRD